MTARLAGKVAIVFGAGQTPGAMEGNGRAIARVFADHGARVGCVDRDLERARETAAMIGDDAFAIQCDVTNRDECAAAVKAVIDRWSALDIVVNNVGIGGVGDGPAHRVDDGAYERIMAVNTKGTLHGISVAVPEMRTRGGGSIINISSIAAVAGAHMVAYEMSKAAVNRLTVSTAMANSKYRIRVNAVAPGFLDTPMAIDAIAEVAGRHPDDVRANRNKTVPLGSQMGTARDTAFAALYLASDEAAFVTGVVLPVDGGMGARVG